LISPRRLGRVVTDIESSTLRSDRNYKRDKVVFPAPDGEDSTNIRPRRAMLWWVRRACAMLFYVLNLFAKLFDRCLELQTDIRELDIVGFGAERVGFAV